MMANLFLDGIITILLVVTISYCWRLSKKIALLNESRHELNQFLENFNSAIFRAENNITQLKVLGGDADEKLCEHIQKARFLANDLSFLMDKGEHVADDLEHKISISRSVSRNIPSGAAPPRPSTVAKPHHAAGQQMAKPFFPTTGKINEGSGAGNRLPPQDAMTPSKKQALDEVLSHIAARKTQSNRPSLVAQPVAIPPEDKNSAFSRRRLAESLANVNKV